MASGITIYDSTGNPVTLDGDKLKELLGSVVVTSPDGSKWEITVDNSGSVKATKK